jgi:hypothetical protein
VNQFNVATQVDGWPVGIDDAGRAWLETATRVALARVTASHGGISLWVLVDLIKHAADADPASPANFPGGLVDFNFACVERAARSVGENVWRIKP